MDACGLSLLLRAPSPDKQFRVKSSSEITPAAIEEGIFRLNKNTPDLEQPLLDAEGSSSSSVSPGRDQVSLSSASSVQEDKVADEELVAVIVSPRKDEQPVLPPEPDAVAAPAAAAEHFLLDTLTYAFPPIADTLVVFVSLCFAVTLGTKDELWGAVMALALVLGIKRIFRNMCDPLFYRIAIPPAHALPASNLAVLYCHTAQLCAAFGLVLDAVSIAAIVLRPSSNMSSHYRAFFQWLLPLGCCCLLEGLFRPLQAIVLARKKRAWVVAASVAPMAAYVLTCAAVDRWAPRVPRASIGSWGLLAYQTALCVAHLPARRLLGPAETLDDSQAASGDDAEEAGSKRWSVVIYSALADHPEPFFGILLVLLPGFIQGPALPGICLVIFSWSPFLELWQAILVSLTLTFGRASALTAPDFHPWKLLAGRVLPAFVLIWAALAVAGFEPHIRCWLRDTLQSSGFGGLSDAAPVTLLATVVASGIIMTCRGIAQGYFRMLREPSRLVCACLWSLGLAATCSTGPFDPILAVSLGLVLSVVLSAFVAARALQMARLPGFRAYFSCWDLL